MSEVVLASLLSALTHGVVRVGAGGVGGDVSVPRGCEDDVGVAAGPRSCGRHVLAEVAVSHLLVSSWPRVAWQLEEGLLALLGSRSSETRFASSWPCVELEQRFALRALCVRLRAQAALRCARLQRWDMIASNLAHEGMMRA